jgi:hypothetical protein
MRIAGVIDRSIPRDACGSIVTLSAQLGHVRCGHVEGLSLVDGSSQFRHKGVTLPAQLGHVRCGHVQGLSLVDGSSSFGTKASRFRHSWDTSTADMSRDSP